ncbi:MAG: sigma-70 family RNA polymerase sigma factor [Verrucomicrobiota bacterium]|nr:sigma-70 family RNA polymerase sigma factor [Verrucomicrobiota bacterium]
MDAIRRLTDNELMVRVRVGDRRAFEHLYERHQARVYAFVWRLMRDEAVAADLRQEAFFRLWEGRGSWKAGGSVPGFLIGVARNLAVDGHRRQVVHDRWTVAAARESPAAPAPDVVLAQEDLVFRVHAAIDSLPDRPREVFILKRDAGLSYIEIAELLGIAPRTVEVHMGKALRLLRGALADLRGRLAAS